MGLELFLICNKCCDEEPAEGMSFATSRRYARENGWRVERNNVTVCPACIDEEKEFARADTENA